MYMLKKISLALLIFLKMFLKDFDIESAMSQTLHRRLMIKLKKPPSFMG